MQVCMLRATFKIPRASISMLGLGSESLRKPSTEHARFIHRPGSNPPQFTVGAEFDSSTDLKYACTRIALLNVYEFDTDLSHYTLKYKEGHTWYLATPIPSADV